jgi:hypothetical protein
MSVVQNQLNLGRELFEINTQVARRMTEIAGEGIKQYFETNQEFAKRLTEVRDLNTFVELQQEYGKTLYSSVSERMQTQGEVLKDAVERGGEALRGAYSPEAAEADVAEEAAAA